jgi:hypothetical protein
MEPMILAAYDLHRLLTDFLAFPPAARAEAHLATAPAHVPPKMAALTGGSPTHFRHIAEPAMNARFRTGSGGRW